MSKSDGVHPDPGNGRKFEIEKGGKKYTFEAQAGSDLKEIKDKDKIIEVLTESKKILEVYSSSPL